MRTSNPVLNERRLKRFKGNDQAMTVTGTVNKTAILLLILCFAALTTWQLSMQTLSFAWPIIIGAGVSGFVIALLTVFKKHWSSVTAPIYAALEGFFLGAFSALFEQTYGGIALQAILLTCGVMAAMLFFYRSRTLKVTNKFRLGVVTATAGVMLLYVVNFVLSFFGFNISFIHEAGILGILFSLFVVGLAALNLILDFDFIESAVAYGMPAYIEWYASFGLLVTMVWLYIEVLRLMSKLRR